MAIHKSKTLGISRVCIACRVGFEPKRHHQVFCTEVCRRSTYANKCSAFREVPRSTSTTGALSELVICADLLRLGFEVFRAVSPSCSCDLIARGSAGIWRVEAKTGIYLSDGSLSFSQRLKENLHDVVGFAYKNGVVIYTNPLKDVVSFHPETGLTIAPRGFIEAITSMAMSPSFSDALLAELTKDGGK